MTDYMSSINSPADLKKLPVSELPALADEIRGYLIKRIDAVGGHLGPNLGVVEATIALHYVFNSPVDKIVWDVSHQTYTHKMLTGRKQAFMDPAHYRDVSGFTHPSESDHDQFVTGHTGTSIASAVGMAKGRDLCARNENVIAFIGDGSMSEGEAFEGLDNAGAMNTNLIIVFNDNGWCIAPNHGGMYKNFAELRESNGTSEHNIFRDFGLDYKFVADGNDVSALIDAFESVKDIDHPIVVHIVTDKGRGSQFAEEHKEEGHWVLPLANREAVVPEDAKPDIAQITSEFLLEQIEQDPRVCVITPATPDVFLPPEFREKAGEHYLDVGIAEQDAVATMSGIAKAGGKPVLEAVNTFLQRAYDQLQQDWGLNGNAGTLLMRSLGMGIGSSDNTHSGAFGIAMTNTIPGLTCLAPVTVEELLEMMDWSINRANKPVVILQPMRAVHESDLPYKPVDPVVAGDKFTDADCAYRTMKRGSRVAVLALGDIYWHGERVVQALHDRLGIDATLISPRLYSKLDEDALDRLTDEHQVIVTIEDGSKTGGFGETIASYFGATDMKVLNYGADKALPDRTPQHELFERYGMTVDQIVGDIESLLDD